MNTTRALPYPSTRGRRQLLGSVASLALAAVAAPAAAFGPAQNRRSSRGRFRLAQDFATPPYALAIVPWAAVEFQAGTDFTLQPGGKVLINTKGLYEITFSCDWDANYDTDIDLRKIGLRLQRAGQPDYPTTDHERQGFLNIPASDPPKMARYQGGWAPPHLALGAMVTYDVTVSPPGVVAPGDTAIASHTRVADGWMPPADVGALMMQAKVVGPDTVRVTLYNPTVAAGIDIPAGTLKVVAMSSSMIRGASGDAWAVLHSASVELDVGDRIYGMIEHKVEGTLLQATRSSFMQVDRLA